MCIRDRLSGRLLPAKFARRILRNLAIFVNENGGKWLTAGYLAEDSAENNLKLSIFLDRRHAQGLFAVLFNRLDPKRVFFIGKAIPLFRL